MVLITNKTFKVPTWKVWRALGEIAEDGQTRYSPQKCIIDGWESPIWEEHPWSLKVVKFLRSIRKSNRGSIYFSVLRPMQEMCAPIMPLDFPHPPTTLLSRDRSSCVELGPRTALCSPQGFPTACSVEEAAHLEDRRSHAWSQRPWVPCHMQEGNIWLNWVYVLRFSVQSLTFRKWPAFLLHNTFWFNSFNLTGTSKQLSTFNHLPSTEYCPQEQFGWISLLQPGPINILKILKCKI